MRDLTTETLLVGLTTINGALSLPLVHPNLLIISSNLTPAKPTESF